ncbi:hypothetical protein IFM89_030443 [Coptis chinensis]|uniref:Uncharacterized protein n=1 Tax=Coptis chinensis TaxID=261450 RepID=A0A835LPC9_9MAGN|nr:hypothetical protein IFM89_030443 [Coptis chinensis]
MQAARLEAHVEQMFDGLDDADGAEDVPFDELVGMQGPVFHLVENAFTTCSFCIVFPSKLSLIAPLVEANKDTNEDPKWGGTAALLTYKLRERKEFSSTTCFTFAPARDVVYCAK